MKINFYNLLLLFVFFLILNKNSYGQLTLSNSPYTQNFNSTTTLPTGWTTKTSSTSTALGSSSTPATTDTWSNTLASFKFCASAKSPLTSLSTTTAQNNSTDRCLAVRCSGSFGDPGQAFVLQLNNTSNKYSFNLNFNAQLLDPQGRTTTYRVDYGVGSTPNSFTQVGSTFTDLGINSGSWGSTNVSINFGSYLDNQSSNVWIRIVSLSATTGGGSRCTFGIDDISLSWNTSPPTLNFSTIPQKFISSYGAPSLSQSFSISGSNLNANITATAPTGFEVSSDGTTYGSTATFSQSSGSASGTLYVRLSASAASGYYNSQNIVLSSSGATSVNITTPSSGNMVANKWWTGTSGNWSTSTNWNSNATPSTTDYILINSGSPTLDVDYEIPSGYNLTLSGTGSLTINPGNKLRITGTADFGGNSVTVSSDATGSGAIVLNGGTLSNATNVTLKQWLTGQRAWRIFANPFTTSTDVTSNIISNNSNISINQSSVNDILTYNNSTGVWNTSAPTSIPANSCYAFFYKGLQSDFTGNVGGLNNYSGNGPSASTYSVNGTLNNSGVSITPMASTGGAKYTLVGNPFAAPVNSSALTALTANTPFYYYSTNSGFSAVTVKSGAWIAVANSSSSITIPMLGVIAYESANASSFTIPTSAINTSGTTVTSGGSNKLFKTTTSNKDILEINLNRNNNMFDKFILREEGSTSNNVIDQRDLTKMMNPIASVYSITPNNEHLAVNTELSFNQAIPVGIQASVGQYEFAVGSNTFSNSDFILIDHYLNQQQVLHNGATYNFEITSDTATKGEHRFEISKQAWTTNVSNVSNELDVKLLSNVITDMLTLYVGKDAEQSKYYLTDTRGAMISKGSLSIGEQQIDMQTLTSGMYILKIVNNNIQQVFKLIKH